MIFWNNLSRFEKGLIIFRDMVYLNIPYLSKNLIINNDNGGVWGF